MVVQDENENNERAKMYENVGGMVRLGSSPGSDQPTTSTRRDPDQPQDELTKRLFLGSLGLGGEPNPGNPRPVPKFFEDAELSSVVRRLLSENSVSNCV